MANIFLAMLSLLEAAHKGGGVGKKERGKKESGK